VTGALKVVERREASEKIPGRIEFEDGSWAQLETEPTHAQFKVITKAYTAMAAGDAGASMDVMTETVAALLLQWTVMDKNGVLLPPTREGVEAARQKYVTPLFMEAVRIYRDQPSPKE